MNGLMDAERLLELFNLKPTISDLPGAKPLKSGDGLVRFDHVSFAYDSRKPTLKDVSFTVPPGKTIALVGETGGGKSTVLKLIDRFYDINSGSISIDGQDIRHVTISSIRERIGVVPQDPVLFNDTIMNNIRYAKLYAADEEVYEACKAASVHDKIMKFPDGYNSKVGDCGVKLSGGEKQRIAIARVILKQPQIILLDEATSAVDTETEELIQKGLQSLCQGRTTFVVAHRLSTIINADHILVVMNGEVIEEGTHEELIRNNGKYKDLWSKQIFFKPYVSHSTKI
ncbi:Heavy metal tolerance protein [Podosphaera aphanis]|nr:Heavy metal tolerance protein [Podosphaera aphanis]